MRKIKLAHTKIKMEYVHFVLVLHFKLNVTSYFSIGVKSHWLVTVLKK